MRAVINTGWTDEGVIALKRLWRDGASMAEIAKELSTSRASVSGKLFRLGLLGNRTVAGKALHHPSPQVVGRRVSSDGRFAYPVMAHPVMATTGAVEASRPKVWTCRADDECSWIVEENGAESLACCAPVCERGRDNRWCADHCEVGFQPMDGSGFSAPSESFVRWAERAA